MLPRGLSLSMAVVLTATLAAGTVAGPRKKRAPRRETAGAVSDETRRAALLWALVAGPETSRRRSAEILGRERDRAAVGPLLEASLRDPSAAVRKAAVVAARSIDATRATRWLVTRFEGRGHGSRSHVQVGRQVAFIQDFDVEIA